MTTAPVFAAIVNYNGWRHTIECLESLQQSTYPDLRVVVVDNASTDDSVARIKAWCDERQWPDTRACPELVAQKANLGFAGGTNVALRRVLTHNAPAYGWLLNNDTVVAPDTLERMVSLAESDPSVGAVGATMLRYHDPDRLETAAGGTFSDWHGMTQTIRAGALRRDPRPPLERLDYISAACLLISDRVLQRVGLMDERYFLYGEDVDFGARIRESGFRLAYCPEAEVWHKAGGTTVYRSPLHDYYNVKSSLLLVHKRNPSRLPAALAYSFGRCVMPKIARAEWKRLRAVGRAYADFVQQVRGGAASSAT